MNKKAIIWTIVSIVVIGGIAIGVFLFKGKTKEYTVSFDTVGGSSVEKLLVKENGTLEKPADPKRTGYIFKGWYMNGKLFDFSTKITKNMVLIAEWEEDKDSDETYYTVKFTGTDKAINDIKVIQGETVTKPADPTKDGYTFEGWYQDDDAYDFTKPVTKDITLTAKWKAKTATGTNTTINATGITLNVSTKTLNIGETFTLIANVAPSNTTNKTVTWTSSDTNIATVNSGVITARAAGTATITAKTSNGKTVTMTIIVNPNPDVYTFTVSIIENENDQDRLVKVYKNGVEVTTSVTLLKTATGSTASKGKLYNNALLVNKNYLDITKATINGTEYTITRQ